MTWASGLEFVADDPATCIMTAAVAARTDIPNITLMMTLRFIPSSLLPGPLPAAWLSRGLLAVARCSVEPAAAVAPHSPVPAPDAPWVGAPGSACGGSRSCERYSDFCVTRPWPGPPSPSGWLVD